MEMSRQFVETSLVKFCKVFQLYLSVGNHGVSANMELVKVHMSFCEV